MTIIEQDLKENIRSLLAQGVFTQKTLATRCAVSQTVISLWLKGEYTGDTAKLEAKLAEILELKTEQQAYTKLNLGYVTTSVSQRVFNVAKMCQLNCDIGVAYGLAGLGKTTAIRQYAKTNPGVIIIDPDENASAKAVVEDLAESLGIKNTKPRELSKEIIRRLRDSGCLVIVDESENLKPMCFRTLRKFHDRCDFTFGLLFIGTGWLYRKLNLMRGDFAYLTSRVGYWEELDELSPSDVESLVRQALPECSNENIHAFYQLTQRNARTVFNTLKRVRDLQHKYGNKLNADIIRQAASLTRG